MHQAACLPAAYPFRVHRLASDLTTVQRKADRYDKGEERGNVGFQEAHPERTMIRDQTGG